MKSIRKQNPLMFDLALFLAFTATSFGAYFLTENGGSTGALISLALLAVVSIALIFSR